MNKDTLSLKKQPQDRYTDETKKASNLIGLLGSFLKYPQAITDTILQMSGREKSHLLYLVYVEFIAHRSKMTNPPLSYSNLINAKII